MTVSITNPDACLEPVTTADRSIGAGARHPGCARRIENCRAPKIYRACRTESARSWPSARLDLAGRARRQCLRILMTSFGLTNKYLP